MTDERRDDDPQGQPGPQWAPFGPSAGGPVPDEDEEHREQQPPPAPQPPQPPAAPKFEPPASAPPPSFEPPSSAPPPVTGPPQPSDPPPGYGAPPPAPPGYGQQPPGYGQPPPGYGQQQPPGYGPPPPPPYATYGVQPYVARKTNGFAIASLILGALWIYWIGSILALVFGYIGKNQIDNSGDTQDGRGLAIAGIVLGWIGVAALVLFGIAIAAGA